ILQQMKTPPKDDGIPVITIEELAALNKVLFGELILRSSEIATVGAIFNFGGKKPDYLA
ncbi:hypothetical protein S83_023960, partial [Arachis hypogaea]